MKMVKIVFALAISVANSTIVALEQLDAVSLYQRGIEVTVESRQFKNLFAGTKFDTPSILSITNKSQHTIIYDPSIIADRIRNDSAEIERYKKLLMQHLTVLFMTASVYGGLGLFIGLSHQNMVLLSNRQRFAWYNFLQQQQQQNILGDAPVLPPLVPQKVILPLLFLSGGLGLGGLISSYHGYSFFKKMKLSTIEKPTIIKPNDTISFNIWFKDAKANPVDLIYSAIRIE